MNRCALGLCVLVVVSVLLAVPTPKTHAKEPDTRYDLDGDGLISRDEVIATIQDYLADKLIRDDVVRAIVLYFSGDTFCLPEFTLPSRRAAVQDYFLEIALGTEYGDAEPLVRKWTQDIVIEVQGNPTLRDMHILRRVMEELTSLTGIHIRMVDDDDTPNTHIHFVVPSEFASIHPGYVPGNYGFFSISWRANEIYQATVLVASGHSLEQHFRDHLIIEEVTQTLGLARDSYTYPDSIFYQEWTSTDRLSNIDKGVIRLLYLDQIMPGMGRDDLLPLFELPFCSTP